MMVLSAIVAAVIGLQASGGEATRWVPYTSNEGKFVVDLPGKPTKSYTRKSRSRTRPGQDHRRPVRHAGRALHRREGRSPPGDRGSRPPTWRRSSTTGATTSPMSSTARSSPRRSSGSTPGPTAATSRSRAGRIPRRAWPRSGSGNTSRRRSSTSSSPRRPRTASCPRTSATSSPRSASGRTGPRRSDPSPSPRGSRWATGASAIDPDGDCKIEDKGNTLEISIPNTHHDLNADNDKLNAPRVLREVTGDFSMTVKVAGAFKPSAKSTNPKAVPYIGGGIVVWQDSDNYIFLGRAAIYRSNKISEFAAFEEREWGTRRRLNNRGIDPGGVYLRVERRNNRHPRLHQQGRQELGAARADGDQLSRHDQGRPLRDQRLHRADDRPVRGLQASPKGKGAAPPAPAEARRPGEVLVRSSPLPPTTNVV